MSGSRFDPRVILYDANGNPLAVADGVAIPANTRGLLVAGSDGANARVINVDANGALRVQSGGTPGSAAPSRALLVGGSDGTNLRSFLTDSLGIQATLSLQQAVGRGLIANALSGFSSGRVATPSTTALTAILRTAYTAPGANTQPKLFSSSASDAAAGTGARKIKVTYYKVSGSTLSGPFTEEVTLNGTTPVNMVATDVRFVEALDTTEAGSGGVAAGTITIQTAASVTIGTFQAGELGTQWAHHYVPSGKTCFVDALNARATSVNFNTFLRYQDPVANDFMKKIGPEWQSLQGATGYTNQAPTHVKIPGPAYIQMWCRPQASSTTAEIHGYFSWFEL